MDDPVQCHAYGMVIWWTMNDSIIHQKTGRSSEQAICAVVASAVLALFHNVSVRWKRRVNLNQTLNWADPREMSFAELVHFPTKQTPFLSLFHLLSSGLCWVTVRSEMEKLNTYRLREIKRSFCVYLAQILQTIYSVKWFYTQIMRNFNIYWI